ncbi:U7 snRNA-associated Sm-like protein LSm11 [Elgaria multicarinata webbii]|uniref:U7 snRNA-associated Sm-like protein LSm11 n=1 Tax=Elgaria multicarinata webbii TaxID=159646 RepID=UPI002FCD6159
MARRTTTSVLVVSSSSPRLVLHMALPGIPGDLVAEHILSAAKSYVPTPILMLAVFTLPVTAPLVVGEKATPRVLTPKRLKRQFPYAAEGKRWPASGRSQPAFGRDRLPCRLPRAPSSAEKGGRGRRLPCNRRAGAALSGESGQQRAAPSCPSQQGQSKSAMEEAEKAAAGPRRRRRSSGRSSTERSPSPGRLDVSSPRFDPLLALYAERTPLPYPAAPCFNNLAEYESFQRGLLRAPRRQRGCSAGTRTRSRAGRAPADPERLQRLRSLMVAKEPGPEAAERDRARARREPRNVLTRMPLHEGSPLGELHRCVRDGVKVNVHIRTFKGLRGVCSGFLVAFDKFWNMALTDVDETYRKPVLGKAFYVEPQLTLTRLFDRLKLQESLVKKGTDSKMAADLPALPFDPRTLGWKPESGWGRSEEERGAKKHSSRERTRSSSLPRTSRKEAELPGRTSQTEGKSASAPRGRSGKKQRPKLDYQQVFTRHINQIFIRGENVLLVHLAH